MSKKILLFIIPLLLTSACSGTTASGTAQQTSVAATVISIQQTAVVATAVQVAIDQTLTAQAAVSTPTATVTETPQQPGYMPSGEIPPINAYEGWLMYENSTYGFTFRYPADWSVASVTNLHTGELNTHAIQLLPSNGENVVLNIAFRSTDESLRLSPSGIGSGEIIERGRVNFVGEAITRFVLAWEGSDISVYYGGTGSEVARGNMAFVIILSNPVGWTPGQPGLSLETEQTVDLIVASLVVP